MLPRLFYISMLVFGQTMAQQQPVLSEKKADALNELSSATEALARRVSRAVVQIFSTGYAFNEANEAANASVIQKQRSSGSGAVLSPDGYIVTNAHVVSGARKVQVQLPYAPAGTRRGKLLDAKVVGVDREADLAVIKIDLTGLEHLALGNSDALKQGQIVFAVGNPLGLENSVSMGVISSTGRQLKTDDPMSYIQTDASINPGNSGGPLLDTEGRVVGVNTFIFSHSGGNEGIGFAIPSSLVRNVYNQIRKAGHVHRGEIGVSAQTITAELAAGLGLPRDYGVLLADVDPDGPADKAGLKVRDIVLSLNGRALDEAQQLELDLWRRPLGEKVSIEVLRGTETLTATVTVAEREGDPQRFADMVNPEKNSVTKLGILGVEIDKETAPMLPDLRNHFGIIVALHSSSPPYSGSGSLQQGDVIYSVNREPVSTILALRAALDAIKPGAPVVLQIERDGKLKILGNRVGVALPLILTRHIFNGIPSRVANDRFPDKLVSLTTGGTATGLQ